MRTLVISFIILASNTVFAQTNKYNRYLSQGKSYFAKRDYLTALDRFDLAFEFTKLPKQKETLREWRQKCTNAIRQQQRDLAEANKNIEQIVFTFLPDGEKDVFRYFMNLGDSLFGIGSYKEAVRNYQLSLNTEKRDKSKTKLENQIIRAKLFYDEREKGLVYFRKNEFGKAYVICNSILNENPGDLITQQYESLASLLVKEMFAIPTSNKEVAEYLFSINEITNLQYSCFLNEYGQSEVKEGAHKNKLMIKEHKWGVYKKNGVWMPKKGYENHPVVNVSWYGANEFCNYFNLKLPVIELLESAIETELFHDCWNIANSNMTTKSVESFKITSNKTVKHNDILGNVWEWCSSINKQGDDKKRIIIGGSYATPVLFYSHDQYLNVDEADKEAKNGSKRLVKDINYNKANVLYYNRSVTSLDTFNSSIGFCVSKLKEK